MNKIKVGIIGATGYAGCELVRLLHSHPLAEVVAVSSKSFIGKKLSEVYPNLARIADKILVDEEQVIAESDIVFASLPHGLSEKIARLCVDRGVKLIDLGADFRLSSEDDYKEWYKLAYEEKALHGLSKYCIPELHRQTLNDNVQIIANPGCYPTSVALGLAPLAKLGLITNLNDIIIDSKSGTTGAGRGLAQNTHYPDCNESFTAYKAGCHRHTPEIEETLSGLCGDSVNITFVPHLLPINRGILSTIYVKASVSGAEELHKIYTNFYTNEKFVRIMPLGEYANLKNVKCSNYCDISVHYDKRTNRVIVTSVIDNMVKGAAGQAIQNMNIMFKLSEDTGLDFVPPAF